MPRQDTASDVDDGGAPVLAAERAAAEHQYLVQAQSRDPLDAARVGAQQRPAPPVHRRHRGVPVASQLGGDLADRPRLASPPCRPPRRPRGHPGPGRRHGWVLAGERAHRAALVRTQPAALVPLQPHRAPERRQIRQADLAGAVTVHLPAAAPTARTPDQLDPDHQRPAPAASHPGHSHTRPETDNQQQRTRKADSHRDPPESARQDTSDSGGSLPTPPAPSTGHPTRKREAPEFSGPSLKRCVLLMMRAEPTSFGRRILRPFIAAARTRRRVRRGSVVCRGIFLALQ